MHVPLKGLSASCLEAAGKWAWLEDPWRSIKIHEDPTCSYMFGKTVECCDILLCLVFVFGRWWWSSTKSCSLIKTASEAEKQSVQCKSQWFTTSLQIPWICPEISWMPHFSPGCRVSELQGGPTTNPWNLLDTWKPFALGKTASDPHEATYPVPGSSTRSKLFNLSDPLRNMLSQPKWNQLIPLNLPRNLLNAALLSWMQGFWTARGSNNKSMEPSRHLKTFCLGENCFRPSRSDLSSARLINQFQFLPFRSFEKTC